MVDPDDVLTPAEAKLIRRGEAQLKRGDSTPWRAPSKMNWRVELSREAYEQLDRFPRNIRERLQRAIDEFEQRDESQWSNIKALQGPAWKGRFRKTVGPYRMIFQKFNDQEHKKSQCFRPSFHVLT